MAGEEASKREVLDIQRTSRNKKLGANNMRKGSSKESERMMMLLQELAALKKGDLDGSAALKRKKEITQEMKRVAAEKKRHSLAQAVGD